MKISILQFSGDAEAENAIETALQDALIRVKRVKNLSRLHIWATSGLFDAIVVGNATLGRYRMIPLRHLWEHHSAQALLVWDWTEGSRLEIAVKTLPAAELGHDWPKGRARKLAVVLNALGNVTVPAARERPRYGRDARAGYTERDASDSRAGDRPKTVILPAFPPALNGSLHRKALDILKLLDRAGEMGASVELIRDAIWPGDERDRKKDIQAYVSRLRGKLNRAFAGRYGILRERNRYILRKLE
jgi:hypothetical protein